VKSASFAAIALAIVAWAVAMCVLEPVVWDGWYIDHWQGGGFWDYVRDNWHGAVSWGNPRLGQYATYATYDTAHLVITPLVIAALFALMLVHVRGRWPDPARDAWVLLVIVGLFLVAQPRVGTLLFYRPYAANYVLGLVVQLVWLIPYRFALERDTRGWAAIVLGVPAGLCNEHTGPALIFAVAAAIVWMRRRGRLRIWMLVGLVAFVVGWVLLMTAPAQSTRYCGVGEMSALGRVTERSLVGTLKILGALAIAGRWMWLVLVLAFVAVRRRVEWRAAAMWIVLGFAISVTLLVSPKQGDRLLAASIAFATIGVVMLLDQLAIGWVRTVLAVAAGVVIVFAIYRTISIAVHVDSDVARRTATLRATPKGQTALVAPFREQASRWFIGDDFVDDARRVAVAQDYDLAAIELEGRPSIPFQYAIRVDGQALPRRIPLRACEARRAFTEELVKHKPATAELAIVSPSPPVPDLAASRWRSGHLVSPRATVSSELGKRWITVSGIDGAFTVTLAGPGRVERLAEERGRFPYEPWARGTYWIIVCAGDCYLAETVRHEDI
jgi:hypothetical protein